MVSQLKEPFFWCSYLEVLTDKTLIVSATLISAQPPNKLRSWITLTKSNVFLRVTVNLPAHVCAEFDLSDQVMPLIYKI